MSVTDERILKNYTFWPGDYEEWPVLRPMVMTDGKWYFDPDVSKPIISVGEMPRMVRVYGIYDFRLTQTLTTYTIEVLRVLFEPQEDIGFVP